MPHKGHDDDNTDDAFIAMGADQSVEKHGHSSGHKEVMS